MGKSEIGEDEVEESGERLTLEEDDETDYGHALRWLTYNMNKAHTKFHSILIMVTWQKESFSLVDFPC